MDRRAAPRRRGFHPRPVPWAATPSPASRELQFCGGCHGRGVFLPDLARSPAILEPDGFKAIVLDGALKSTGMAPFRRFFDEAGAEDLRAFLLRQAKTAPPRAPEAPRHAQ